MEAFDGLIDFVPVHNVTRRLAQLQQTSLSHRMHLSARRARLFRERFTAVGVATAAGLHELVG